MPETLCLQGPFHPWSHGAGFTFSAPGAPEAQARVAGERVSFVVTFWFCLFSPFNS